MVFRSSSMRGLVVVTFIPSAAGVVHDVTGLGMPSISTRQSLHPPKGVSFGWWHSVGMAMPTRLAASRTVIPCFTVANFPSIVRVTISATPFPLT